tara:strand:+ start:463 stop:861 length:399 start_codon:yes stop_codon:yes gene_type:complete
MTKQYRTKQTVIDEQAEEISKLNSTINDLEKKVAREKDITSYRDGELKKEREKINDLINPDITVTVFEESYMVQHERCVLSQTEIYLEDFYIDRIVSTESKVKDAIKLRDSLSDFYQSHSTDVRVVITISSR